MVVMYPQKRYLLPYIHLDPKFSGADETLLDTTFAREFTKQLNDTVSQKFLRVENNDFGITIDDFEGSVYIFYHSFFGKTKTIIDSN